MISFRYHVVSIVAVFLALAVGVVVGTAALNGPITTNLRNQVNSLKGDRSGLQTQNGKLTGQLNDANQFAATFGGQIVKDALSGKTVAVISMPGASTSVTDGIERELTAAGATLTTRVELATGFTSPARADDVRSLVTNVHPIGLNLPQVSDAGTLAGALVGYVLLSGKSQQTDIQQVFNGFATLQMLHVVSSGLAAADLAVVIGTGTMSANNNASAATELSFVAALGQAGPTVVAGDAASDTGGGLVALVRASAAAKSSVTTVDDADTAAGQVSVPLALAQAGKPDAYGSGSGADDLFPPSK